MKIRRNKPNDLTMSRRLWKHVLIALQHIAKTHAVGVGQSSRTNNVSFEINGTLAVWQDWCNADTIAILHLKRSDGLLIALRTFFSSHFQGDGLALLIGIDALNRDVTERSRCGKAACIPHHRSKRRLSCLKLVNCRALDRS